MSNPEVSLSHLVEKHRIVWSCLTCKDKRYDRFINRLTVDVGLNHLLFMKCKMILIKEMKWAFVRIVWRRRKKRWVPLSEVEKREQQFRKHAVKITFIKLSRIFRSLKKFRGKKVDPYLISKNVSAEGNIFGVKHHLFGAMDFQA